MLVMCYVCTVRVCWVFFFLCPHPLGVYPTSVCHTSVCHCVWFVHPYMVVFVQYLFVLIVCLYGVQPVLLEPDSGTSAQCLVVLLYNVSGQCNWWLFVRCHCVMDVLSCSVMICWLMAIWMNVVHTVVARFFFFFFLATVHATWMPQPLPLCGGALHLCFLDRGSDAVVFLVSLLCPHLPRIGEGNRLHFLVLLLRLWLCCV